MLMSQRAISSALTAAPNAGGLPVADGKPAQAASAAAPIAMTTVRSDVNIFHAPVGADRPAHYGVVVIGIDRVLRQPRLARRLHLPLFVGGAALQHRFLARPFPGQAEAHQALRAFLSGEHRVEPSGAAIGGDFDAADASGTAPGDPGDLVEAGARQLHSGR